MIRNQKHLTGNKLALVQHVFARIVEPLPVAVGSKQGNRVTELRTPYRDAIRMLVPEIDVALLEMATAIIFVIGFIASPGESISSIGTWS